jgi:predicted amidohydrolase YtcJ
VLTSGSQGRDVVLANGRIRATFDDDQPASALSIRGGTVVGWGTADDARAAVGRTAEIIDLGGRIVLPAFIDSHTHFHRAAQVRHLFLDFDRLRPTSVADVLDAVATRAADRPGTWIQGDSLRPATLAEGRLPARQELDAAAGGRPVILRGVGKHVVAASSAALAAAGIDRTTADPPGGRIEHDSDGEPTGILHERAKLRLDPSDAATVVPAVAEADRRTALRAALGDLHRLGITTIHEMIRLPDEVNDWTALHASAERLLRLRLFYRIHETPIELDDLVALGIRRGIGDDWLRVLGVKISVDGWCTFRNAAVDEPYVGEPANRGLFRIEPGPLAALVARANGQGLQIALHAVGGRAVDVALDAFIAAGPASAGPYRLEHGHLDVGANRLARMRDLDVVWSVQPGLLEHNLADWEQSLEPDRIEAILPLRTAGRLGLRTIHNSDVPSGPQAPLAAIAAAVTRAIPSRPGRTIAADQAIGLGEAWRAWTEAPAATAGDLGLGRLGPGALADLVVLDDDPRQSSIEALAVRPVFATMIDGRFVHGLADVAR